MIRVLLVLSVCAAVVYCAYPSRYIPRGGQIGRGRISGIIRGGNQGVSPRHWQSVNGFRGPVNRFNGGFNDNGFNGANNDNGFNGANNDNGFNGANNDNGFNGINRGHGCGPYGCGNIGFNGYNGRK